jgi:hypothetical protein
MEVPMHVDRNAGDRASKLDHWVELQALMILTEGGWAGDSPWFAILETIDMFDSPVIRRLRQLLGGELFEELWPTDESTETAECEAAYARAMLLALQMFERLQARHAENIDHLAGQAAATLARLSASKEVLAHA